MDNRPKVSRNRYIRWLFNILGTISVGLGIIGIFLPVMPTTVFLLIGAWCYFRGSEKMYFWLLNNKYFGDYIRNYREKRGIPLMAKIISICVLWITILTSMYFVDYLWLRILLPCIATGVTIHLIMIKTYKEENYEEEYENS